MKTTMKADQTQNDSGGPSRRAFGRRVRVWTGLIVLSVSLLAVGASVERSGAAFHSYEFEPVADTPAPDGFRPFYISHFGRHGSRRQIRTIVPDALAVLERNERDGGLTEQGRALLADVRTIAAVHDGMVGQLAARGAEEHRLLARRMAARFPDVFAGARHVRCQSSPRPRVLLSQANFTMELKDAAPGLDFSFVTGDRYYELLSGPVGEKERTGEAEKIAAATDAFWKEHVDPAPLAARLFVRRPTPDAALAFARNLFSVASICPCLRNELAGMDIYRFFTQEEIESFSHALEAEHYAGMADPADFGTAARTGSRPLARDFVRRADEAVADGRIAADLRFGHDSGLWPFTVMLDLEGPAERVPFAESWRLCPAWKWMPMASNLQLVFYRDRAGEVLVKVLYNEREMRINGLSPVQWPYYRWRDLKERMMKR